MNTQLQKREFAGFLMGEGCFRISKILKPWPLYKPVITVSLRSDDAEILKWAKETYGGTLILRQGRPQIPNQNPYYMWVVDSAKGCLEIINDFLASELPSTKKKQATILREVCEMKIARHASGHRNGTNRKWYTDEELAKQEETFQELKRLKLFVN